MYLATIVNIIFYRWKALVVCNARCASNRKWNVSIEKWVLFNGFLKNQVIISWNEWINEGTRNTPLFPGYAPRFPPRAQGYSQVNSQFRGSPRYPTPPRPGGSFRGAPFRPAQPGDSSGGSVWIKPEPPELKQEIGMRFPPPGPRGKRLSIVFYFPQKFSEILI